MTSSEKSVLLCLLLILGQAWSQCDKCELLLSQTDCENSKVHQLQCKWLNDMCTMKLCKDYTTRTECRTQDDGSKCYWSEKRGCQKMGACSNVEKCDGDLAYWCKPIYNGAWCVDEIYFSEFSCYQKLDEASCIGTDGQNENYACQWRGDVCTSVWRGTNCKEFTQERICGMMFSCNWVNGICVSAKCEQLAREKCTRIQTGIDKYEPCIWNEETSKCEPFDPTLLNEKYCLDYTLATYTWNDKENKCVACQGSSGIHLLVYAALIILFAF